ncbi:cytochrome P-450, putative [Pediculus humanus corporis]|uniref:Cytochrome P-450, putative n=1 Tax=Pediculus humanus subsp. corporis TaxID=121224 RepID=E0W115_PEDHC|nr:cytochrome P-450, putative [Pediculus humanus corporis]EEB19321.1 cytochrome P-450, putative [Pediculus humanus corporis]
MSTFEIVAQTTTLFFTLQYSFLPISIILATFYYFHFKFIGSKYWKNKNIFHLKPNFLIGNIWKVNFLKSFASELNEIYYKYKNEKLIGFWMFTKPVLLVTDLNLIKNILIKDFEYFHDHGLPVDFNVDHLAGHLFNLSGSKWKNLRIKLTPTFTSGKMKQMFRLMNECGRQLQQHVRSNLNKSLEVHDLFSRYGTDVISSCAFGIETNSMTNPNSDFRIYGKKIFESNFSRKISRTIFLTFPKFAYFFGFRLISKDVSDFFTNAVKETMEYREKNKIIRNDFLHLLMQLKNNGKIDDGEQHLNGGGETTTTTTNGISTKDSIDFKFTIKEAAAQAFVFFFAGFETTSSALTSAMYELALNPGVQKKLQFEIDDVREKHDGEITYESLTEMQYLNSVVQETLRKYPPIFGLTRHCTKDYTVPDMDGVTIPKNSRLFIPIQAIQNDPDYFVDPDKFDPDRQTPEERQKRNYLTSLHFGEGPRYCIGNRFAINQIKIGIVSLLSRFEVFETEKTPKIIKYKLDSLFSLSPFVRKGKEGGGDPPNKNY